MRARRAVSARALAATLAAALVLGACGSDDEGGNGGETGGPAEATDVALHVSDNPFGVTEVDLAALRSELGLAADADPSEPGDADHGRFAAIAQTVVPVCSEDAIEPIDEAIVAALDCSRIQAAAAMAGTGIWSLTILRTDQPFDEIAESLAAAGYERRGRILGYTGGSGPMRYAEVVADEGPEPLIALARESTAGFAALGEGPADPGERPELAALGELPAAPARTGRLNVDDCVSAYALADLVAENRGELLVELASDEEADPERFELDRAEGFTDSPGSAELFEFSGPEADGSSLRVPFALLEGAARERGAIAAFDDLSFPTVYRC